MDIQISQIIFQIINFGVVAGALTVLLYKPILKTLKQRSQKIEESQKAAEEILSEKDKIDQLKKQTLEKVKKESAKLMTDASKEAEQKKAALLNDVKQQVKDLKKAELEKWEKEKAQMMKNFQQELHDAVFLVTEKAIGKGLIDQKTHGKLIDQSIAEL